MSAAESLDKYARALPQPCIMNVVTSEKLIDHPLEDIFNIESGTTIVEYQQVLPSELVVPPTYDSKDVEIENQLEEVYSIAMSQVTAISDEMDRVEGRHKARVGEVAATMLNVALSAIKEKNVMKMSKDRNATSASTAGTPHTLNQNLIVADRNILKALRDGKSMG